MAHGVGGESYDLIVRHGLVLRRTAPHDFSARVEDVGIVGDRIAAIGDLSAATAGPREGLPSEIEAEGSIVIPGLVNGHVHSYSAPFPGSGVEMRLDQLICRARQTVDTQSEETRYLVARWAARCMLKSGITTVLDQPAQGVATPWGVAQAYIDTGIRAFVAPMVSDLSYDGWLPQGSAVGRATEADTADVVAQVRDFAEWLLRRSQRVRPALGPFAPGVCSDSLLVALAETAREKHLPMHTHLDEARWQRDHALRARGESSIARLGHLGVLNRTFSLAHAVWVSDADLEMLATYQCSIVHNPLSNLLLANGVAPVRQALQSGLNVAVGSDGINAGCTFDLFEHMRVAAALLRMREAEDASAHRVKAGRILAMATAGGALALGLQGEIGDVAPGARADLVILNPSTPQFLGHDEAVQAIVFGCSSADVSDVVVDGEVVVRDGRLTRIDEEELEREMYELIPKLHFSPTSNSDSIRVGGRLTGGHSRTVSTSARR